MGIDPHRQQDPLDELRTLWNQVERDSSLKRSQERPDQTTRAVVDWMHAAWQAAEAPALAAPVAREVKRRVAAHRKSTRGPRPMRVPAWVVTLPFAAAALFAWRFSVPSTDALPDRDPGVPAADSLILASADNAHEPIRPRFRDDGSVEFVSGSVRLHLVSTQEANATPMKPETAEPESAPIR